jgi:protein SDA1
MLDLLQLQDKARRDASAYREEFLLQHRRYLASLEVLRLKPSTVPDEFPQLVNFLSHVAESYRSTLHELPTQLGGLIDSESCQLLDPVVRKAVVAALILLRNRGLVEATVSLPIFFRCFRVQDKQLRAVLYKHIVNDVRNINRKGQNDKLNRTLQNFMYHLHAALQNRNSEVTESYRPAQC